MKNRKRAKMDEKFSDDNILEIIVTIFVAMILVFLYVKTLFF